MAKKSDKSREKVIVLHGIFRSCHHMRKVTKFFREHGYDTDCIKYPSTKFTIMELVEYVHSKILEKTEGKDFKKIHFIGYSLGGVITRLLLSKYKLKNLGRVVLLAPPNKGSEVASFLKNFWPYKLLWGPAGQELELGLPTVKKHLKKTSAEIGVIAGNYSIDMISSIWLIKGEDDGKVSVESTKFNGMSDHIILPVSHTFFPLHKSIHEQTLAFIENGKFKR